MEQAQHLAHNGEHAHAVADSVRSGKQKIGLLRSLQADGAQLRLIIGEGCSQFPLALTPVLVFSHPRDNPEWNGRSTVLFVREPALFCAN